MDHTWICKNTEEFLREKILAWFSDALQWNVWPRSDLKRWASQNDMLAPVGLPLTFMGLGKEYQWGPSYHMSDYLRVTNPVKKYTFTII